MQDPNKIISFVVAFQVIAQGCKNIFVQGFPFFYEINDMLNMVIMGGSLLMYIYALLFSTKLHTPVSSIAILWFVVLTYLFTYLLYPQNYVYISPTILRTLITCFFTFLLVSKLRTFKYLSIYFTKGSIFITFSGILYAVIINAIGHSTTSEWSSYSMTMSNVVLLSILWQISDFINNKSKLMLLMAIVGSAIIFLYGSRNPFLAIVAFILFKTLFEPKKGKGGGLKVLIIGIITAFVLFFKEILGLIASIVEGFGLSSRTLYYLMNADTEDITTGRAEIHERLWDIILNNPFMGLGIAGDEATIEEMAHSMYLSVFVTFGLIIGIFVLGYLFKLTIKGIRRSKGMNHEIIMLYVCIVFPRSFTGGDIWINDYLWFMMALIIASLNQQRILWKRKKNMNLKTIINAASPKLLTSLQYYYHFHKCLNWTNPRSLNEKINWLKINSDTSLWTLCADKYRVREYVREKGLDNILVKLYGMWKSVDDVDWSKLPSSFVLKTNNGSGDVLICSDISRLNIEEVKRKYSELLSQTFSNTNAEPHYAAMKPCLIAEELLDCKKQQIDTDTLIDYKIWCFNGKPHHVWACYNRHENSVEVATYDLDWIRHDECSVFTLHYEKAKSDLPRPKSLDRMLEIASKLSEGFPQVRIDLYEVDETPYFGEMTFTSAGGFMNFYTQDFLNEMGDLVDLSCAKR